MAQLAPAPTRLIVGQRQHDEGVLLVFLGYRTAVWERPEKAAGRFTLREVERVLGRCDACKQPC